MSLTVPSTLARGQGVAAPVGAPSPEMLRTLFCYLCLAPYLVVVWYDFLVMALVNTLLSTGSNTVASSFMEVTGNFMEKLEGHQAWFLCARTAPTADL